jgi:predicted nucleic acid-binding protein
MAEALLDTNILVRQLTGDPPALASQAKMLLEAAEQQGYDLVVAPAIFAEVIYVLESFYKWPRQVISERLLDLIDSSTLVFLEQETVRQALVWYRDVRRLSFADAYVAALAVGRGHGLVLSMDRDLRRAPGVTVVEDATQLPQ